MTSSKRYCLTLTALPAFTRSSNVLDLDKLDDGLVHTLYGICTHHFWSAGSVSALDFRALRNDENNKSEKRQKLPTGSCDDDHGYVYGRCGSHSREGEEKKEKREMNPLLNQDGIDYLQTKHSHICFKLFFAVSACARWPRRACSLQVELQTGLQLPVSLEVGG